MSERLEKPGIIPETKKFAKTEEAWDAVQAAVLKLAVEEIHLDVEDDKPLLGDIVNGEDHIAYTSLKEAFMDPDVTVELLHDEVTQDLLGYTFAIPMERFNPGWTGEKAAYIYGTVIRKEDQGKGLVQHIIDPLFRDLASQGYTMVTRDAMVDNGYAASIDKRFGGEGIITKSYEHDKYTLGLQKYYEINVPAYVATLDTPR